MDRRDYEAQYRAEQRRARNALVIPKCKGSRRRAKYEGDDCRWLSYYLAPRFARWTPMRRQIVEDVRGTIADGGYRAIAATRGEGKSSIVEGLALKTLLTGEIDFVLILGATGPMAERLLNNCVAYLETKPRLLEDYPEVVYPIRALGGVPQNARTQHVDGQRLRMQWAGPVRKFAEVPGSRSAGAILAAAGMDAAIRGYNVEGRRPKLVIVDDPDTRESTRPHSAQTEQKLEVIENDVAGLGDDERPAAVVALCNIPSRTSVGYILTDRQQKPSWRGRRYPLVVQWPERDDLWESYVARRNSEMSASGLGTARETDDWYLSQRALMDRGGKVSNPDRYRKALADDNRPYEVSAIQAVYNCVADRGWHYVLAELQLEPPEDERHDDTQLSAASILGRAVGLRRSEIPADAAKITIGLDAGKYFLHWVAVAWQRDGTSQIVDYDTFQVVGVKAETDRGLDLAIAEAVYHWGRAHVLQPIGGRIADKTACDLGYRPDGMVAGMRQLGSGRVTGCRGTGDDLTPAGERQIWRESTGKVRVGENWQIGYRRRYGGHWLLIDSDHWKQWIRDRLATTPGQRGAMTLFQEPGHSHQAFAEHLENEQWDPIKGKWVAKRRNHWGDALYYAAAAASVEGIRLFEEPAQQRVSWAEKQAQARRAHGAGGG